MLRRQTINTRISMTKTSHHSNWSTIPRPNLGIDFSHDLEDREVDSVSLNLKHLDHFFLFEKQLNYFASKEKYSFEYRKNHNIV